jgi:hypothetical protein
VCEAESLGHLGRSLLTSTNFWSLGGAEALLGSLWTYKCPLLFCTSPLLHKESVSNTLLSREEPCHCELLY